VRARQGSSAPLASPQEVQKPPSTLREIPRGFLCALFFRYVRSLEVCLSPGKSRTKGGSEAMNTRSCHRACLRRQSCPSVADSGLKSFAKNRARGHGKTSASPGRPPVYGYFLFLRWICFGLVIAAFPPSTESRTIAFGGHGLRGGQQTLARRSSATKGGFKATTIGCVQKIPEKE